MSPYHSEKATSKSRRDFITNTGKAVCGVSLFGLGLGLYSEQSVSRPINFLRPPGALPEKDFLSACVRCGLCVRDCPYDTLKLGTLGESLPTGTPYFEARDIPCEMCEDIPCVAACPTGALAPELTEIDDARMGLAVLIDQENCLNFLGLRCDVCYRVCPAIDEAITLERHRNERTGSHAKFIPTVHSDHCTGCGKCEQSCVLDTAAIKVIPLNVARGKRDEHYRMGWEEKQKAGQSLIPDALTLPVRKPGQTP